MVEKLDNPVISNHDIVFQDIDSDIATFFSILDIDLTNIKLENINLDDDKFDDYNPETINHIRLMACYNGYEQHKTYRKKER